MSQQVLDSLQPEGLRTSPQPEASIIVIEDPKRGDFANVLAIGNLLSEKLHARVEIAPLHLRGNIVVPLVKTVLAAVSRFPFLRTPPVRRTLQRLLFSGHFVGEGRPITVVSTLGRGEAQGAFLGCFLQIPAIHLGTPKRISRRFFSAAIAHPGDRAQGAEVAIAVAPTRVRLSSHGGKMSDTKIRKICLLLGGNAQSVIRYEDGFWQRCLAATIATAIEHGASLTVSTSPRTGAAGETIIAQTLSHETGPDYELFLFGRGDRRDIVPEIASADAVFVTAESISMVSDAVASGARVLALHDGQMPTSKRVTSFLNHLAAAGLLRIVDLSAWDGTPLSVEGVVPLRTCWSKTLWDGLAPVLDWQAMRADMASPPEALSVEKARYR